jgi:hypothetical protein
LATLTAEPGTCGPQLATLFCNDACGIVRLVNDSVIGYGKLGDNAEGFGCTT